MFRRLAKSNQKSSSSSDSPSPQAEAKTSFHEIPVEIVQEIEAEYPEEDGAQKREHFERVFAFPAALVFQTFVQFVWRENAQLAPPNEWVEILQDSKSGALLEIGMIRKVNGYFGYEEEVTKVSSNRMIEFKIREGLPSSYNKSRVVFKSEDASSTRVIWTIFWTPASMVADMMYTVMMNGFCNLALYRLDQHLRNVDLEDILPSSSSTIDDDSVLTSSRDEDSSLSAAASTSFDSKLQWAARLQTGYEGNLTSEQLLALDELREKLRNTEKDTWHLCETHLDGPDRIMLRFLRAECTGKARKFHVDKSLVRLIESLQFRKQWQSEGMLVTPPARNADYCKIAGETVITDYEGRPVVFTRAGILSTCVDIKLMDEVDWKRNMIWVSECRMQHMRESSIRLGHEVSASVIVYDLKGLSYNFRKIIAFTKLMNEVGGPYYPEMVDVVVLVNAPPIFNALWTTMKAFLDPVTTSKVMVFGQGKHDTHKAHKALRNILDPKLLPKEYGGDSDLQVAYPGRA